MVELLKQPQFQPLHFADQVMSIFAGTQGYFDAVPVNKVAEAERELLRFMREEKSEVRNAIISSKNISGDTEKLLRAALDEFRTRFAQKTK